jgi:ADP-heptose:LPS heptosyltransferase
MWRLIRHLLSNLKHIRQTLLVNVIDRLATKKQSAVPGTLLLIHLDAIGDYVIFRNAIRELKVSEKFRGFRITLCGNIAYKELAEWLDNEEVADFIWLDRKRFRFDIRYRFKMISLINSKGFAVAINPSYSRIYYWGDSVIRASQARERIGSSGDLTNTKRWQKWISDRFYTRLIPVKEVNLFEFYRVIEFMSCLLGTRIVINKPFIEQSKLTQVGGLPEKYGVVFVGGSSSAKQWNPRNYAKVARHLHDVYGFSVVIAGGNDDKKVAADLEKFVGGGFCVDLAGKTSLQQITNVISGARILVSNETSAVHLAVAVGTKVVCVANGNQFGRFYPYPVDVFPDAKYVYPPDVAKNLGDFDHLIKMYAKESMLDIDSVPVEEVIRQIDMLIANTGIAQG